MARPRTREAIKTEFSEWLAGKMEGHGLRAKDVAEVTGARRTMIYKWLSNGERPLREGEIREKLEARWPGGVKSDEGAPRGGVKVVAGGTDG